jgi:hypothetical protein
VLVWECSCWRGCEMYRCWRDVVGGVGIIVDWGAGGCTVAVVIGAGWEGLNSAVEYAAMWVAVIRQYGLSVVLANRRW